MAQLSPADRRKLEALNRWATILDAAFGIPGTRVRFGLDGLIGLVPGVGDALAALFSAAIILQAARLGVPRVVLLRMAFNALLDTLLGAVPFLGDIFDVAWKANLKNVRLLERFVHGDQRGATARDYAFLAFLLAGLLLAASIPLVVLYFLWALFTAS